MILVVKRWNKTTSNFEQCIEKLDTNGLIKQVKASSDITCFEFVTESLLASGHTDGTINIWNIFDMNLHKSIKYHSERVNSIIKINNDLFSSGSNDNTIIFYNLTDFSQIGKITDTVDIKYLRLLNETTIAGVICCTNRIKFWDIQLYSFKTQISINPWYPFFELVENGFLAFYVINVQYEVFVYDPKIHVVNYSIKTNERFNSLYYYKNFLIFGYMDGQIEICNRNVLNASFKIESSIIKYFDSINGIIASVLFINKINLINAVNFQLINTISTSLLDSLNCFIFVKNSSIVEQNYLPNKNLTQTSSSTVLSTTKYNSVSSEFQKLTIDFTKFYFGSLKEELVIELIQTELDLTDCISNCSNRGSCILKSNKRFTCSCFSNFQGDSCQYDSRQCTSNPCLNNGSCIDFDSKQINSSLGENTYLCECDQFYLGKNCEIEKDICENETCSGNGYCYNFENRPKCKCFSMYLGEKCDVESNDIKVVKSVIKTSSIIAILVIIAFVIMFPVFDILSLFGIPSKQHRVNSVLF
ncbi:unnamed protein product, partial [Brachionus calyciflorus]